MGSFHRVDTSKLVRGAARIMYAPSTQPKPAKIDDVIKVASDTSTNEVQSVAISGTPTGGTFTLSFRGETTGTIQYNAASTAVQSALEALSSIGFGNVTVAGGPGPASPWTVTFTGTLAASDVQSLTGTGNFTGGTTPTITVTETTAGTGQYDARAGWKDLGATREGIQININNTEDAFEIDQISGEIGTAPNAWECSVGTQLAEMTLENLVMAWEGASITTDTVANERETGFAGATSYTERRLAVLFKKPNDKIQGYFFHRAVRSPQEGTLEFRKGGDPMTIAIRFKILADSTEVDPKKQFYRIREQI